MNLADCYRLLGLRTGASYEEIKASYRRLVRQLHPDVNPNDERAKDRFIRVTEAYRFLLSAVHPTAQAASSPAEPADVVVTRKPPAPKPSPVQQNLDLSLTDKYLKQSSYEQLQQLFKTNRFPRAIALVEGLAQRLPEDLEVRQWQAITYQRWGHHLIQTQEFEKARVYLKKALRTDPHNRSLWAEVERDFHRLEQGIYHRR
ncbi:J domain-containing protein [Myxacorys almedinensis]|uniref:DnaJ domain-containing protein n=1 Tax=Myxacorys almedinensis A TaxID=2690445 RepID=A0A8J7Z553_9CYAN|nr:J domain-containing protein [Myxacorys almedinensis]NDJ18361.1 DnaJ domain-containing protein [Myxacorys almedinensis A]